MYMKQRLFVAGKAMIVKEKKVLILQEGIGDIEHVHEGKWQLLGGRIDFGEHPHEGLLREVYEETGLHIYDIKPLYVDHWQPQVKDDEIWQIVGVFYHCDADTSTPVVLSNEHKEYAWIDVEDIDQYKLLPEDLRAINIMFQNPD